MTSFNQSCSHKDTCRQEDYEKVWASSIKRMTFNLKTPDWKSKNCMCDNDCSLYGDCCADAIQLNASISRAALDRFTCVTVQKTGSYYMIAKCPKSYHDDTVRLNCENVTNEQNVRDFALISPVTNEMLQLTYRNYYCAVCNSDNEDELLQIWKPKLVCSPPPKFPTSRATRLSARRIIDKLDWKDELGWFFPIHTKNSIVQYSCNIDSYELPPGFNPRPCQPSISNCVIRDPAMDIFCGAYAGYVEIDQQVYRNIHCALCNGLKNYSEFSCDIFSYDDGVRETPLASFPILFDLKSTDGNGDVGLRCGLGKLYDPFFKECRQIYCPEKNIFVLKDNKCIPKITETTMSVSAPSTSSFNDSTLPIKLQTCQKLLLNKGDYDLKANGSLYVPAYGRSYNLNEFQLVNDSAVICRDWVAVVLKFEPVFGWVTLICVIISEICLLIHIIIEFTVPNLTRKVPGKNLQCLCISLFVAFGFFLCVQFVPSDTGYCVVVAVLTHYSFLAAFFWTSAIAFDVFSSIISATKQLRQSRHSVWKFLLYSLWSWLTPLIIVAISAAIEWGDPNFYIALSYHPHYGKNVCWFGHRSALVVFFATPLVAIMVANLVFFTWSLFIIRFVSENLRKSFVLFSRLAILMGLSWIFGLIAGIFHWSFLWYFFIVLSALQGLYILIAFGAIPHVWNHFGNRKGLQFSSTGETYF
ncbi:hypothetical protein QYM36_008619 [Artemia franciscana]|uniref:G-protein coupled receptors family 2 profile 2 domain-containing protein n=2 Tax=Artemia franciscana TaxID=6661 RepID=A0AA88HLJ9_ARTSF|nr:hypothetical protein QYM36_008619 [Artemia franciscana]